MHSLKGQGEEFAFFFFFKDNEKPRKVMLFDLYFKFGCFVENGWEDGERGSRGSWEAS